MYFTGVSLKILSRSGRPHCGVQGPNEQRENWGRGLGELRTRPSPYLAPLPRSASSTRTAPRTSPSRLAQSDAPRDSLKTSLRGSGTSILRHPKFP